MGNTTNRPHGYHSWKWLSIAIFLIVSVFGLQAQITEQPVTLRVQQTDLADVLFELSEQAHFDFSYDSRMVASGLSFSMDAQQKPLGDVLDDICKEADLRYKLVGNQVVFLSSSKDNAPKSVNRVEGRVTDPATGAGVAGVQVRERYFDLTATTDSQGAYALSIPNPNYTVQLNYSQEGYEEKSLMLNVNSDKTINVALQHTAEELPQDTVVADTTKKPFPLSGFFRRMLGAFKPDTTKEKELSRPLIKQNGLRTILPKRQMEVIEGDSLLETVPAQVSIWPGFSTTGREGGKSLVRGFSFNFPVGFNAGVTGAEIGLFVNITRFNMTGMQTAGFGNMVGGQTVGLQIAGLSNFGKMQVKGGQIGGLSNMAGQRMVGLQLGGLSNLTRGDMTGLQVGGLNNVATGCGTGAQISGLVNASGMDFEGFQLAGLGNLTNGRVKGMQLGGLANLAREVDGVQLAGLFNYTERLHGVQIGFVNFAVDGKYGVPIGFLSWAKDGYRRIELQGTETGLTHLRFKTGVPRFYNILAVGAQLDGAPSYWDIGYGFGTLMRENKKLYFSLEGMCYWMSPNRPELNLLNRIDLNLNIKLYNSLALFFGPAFNVQVSGVDAYNATNFVSRPIPVFKEQHNNVITESWVGFSAGLHF